MPMYIDEYSLSQHSSHRTQTEMPPPKKPKTGLSRVEAFLTKTEVDDLRRDYLTRTTQSTGTRWCSDSSSEFIAHEQSLLSSRMDLTNAYSEEAQDLSMHKPEPAEPRVEAPAVRTDSDASSRSCSPHTTKLIDMIMSERSSFASKEGHRKRLEAMLADYGPGQVAASASVSATASTPAVFPSHTSCLIDSKAQLHRKAFSKPMPSLQYVPLHYTDCHMGEPAKARHDVSLELIKKVIDTSQTGKLDALMRRCTGSPRQWSQAARVTCAAPKMISTPCLSDTRLSPPRLPLATPEHAKDLLAEKRNLCKFLETGKSGVAAASRLQQMLTSSMHGGNALDTMLPSCGQWKPDTPANSTDGSTGSPSLATDVCGINDNGIIYKQKQATSLLQKHVELDAAARSTVTLTTDEVKCSMAASLTSVDTTTTALLTASSPHHPPTSCSLEPQSETTYEMPSSTMGEMKKQPHELSQPQPKSPSEGRLCQICYDSASGFHYGVWSCEGCKAFFKRSLQGPVDYICPATNTCKIDKHRRKSCQACRLRKCLSMGMSKGNCRKEKSGKSGRATKRKAELKDTDTIEAKMFKDDSRSPQCSPQHSFTDGLRTALPMSHNSLPMPLSTSTPSGCDLKMTEAPPMHPLVEHLLQIDPPVRMTGHDNSQPDTELGLITSLIKLADLELVDIISWAKAIPGYPDLGLQDRVHLLETCWTEVIVCGLMWRSMPFSDCENLVFAPDLYFNKSRCVLSKFWPICLHLSDLRNVFRRLNVNREEFVLIRTMVLLNADMNMMATDAKWTEMKQKANEAFHYTVVTRHGGSYDRLMQILFLLPHIRNVGLQLLRWLFQVKEERGVLLCDLLQEMLNADTSLHRLNHRSGSTSSPPRG